MWVATGALLTLAPSAQAAETLAVAFDLPSSAPTSITDEPTPTAPTANYYPLPIPPAATQPPTRGQAATENPRVYQSKATSADGPVAQLPPPPGALPSPRVIPPLIAQAPASSQEAAPKEQPAAPAATPARQSIGLGFPEATVQPPPAQPPATTATAQATNTNWIFEGGSDSLVARVVGSAEGTRTATGERTRYYRGHTDPGNGVWNLGTFSYQHGADSPEAADEKQLARLARQEKSLVSKADRLGLQLTLVERLNALDLANQSPAAALNQGGYIDRLHQAHQAGRTGDDAILWARTYAYMNPKTQRWNAPGLGNTYQSIRRDQNRRLQAIASALDAYQMQQAMAANAPTEPPPKANNPEVFTAPGTAPQANAPQANASKTDAPQTNNDRPIAFALLSPTQPPSASRPLASAEPQAAPPKAATPTTPSPGAAPTATNSDLDRLRSGALQPLRTDRAEEILSQARSNPDSEL